jgi:hypothetical protein
VESASLKQLWKLALVPGESRNRFGLFVESLHPREASKATHGIGDEDSFLEAHTAFSQRLAIRRSGYPPEAKQVARSPME